MASTSLLRFVTPRYGKPVLGGAEGLVRRLAAQLALRGRSVEAWATTAVTESTWAGELPTEEGESGVLIRRFRVERLREPATFHRASRVFFRLPARLRNERKWVRAQGPYAPQLVDALAHADAGVTLFIPYLYYPTLVGVHAAPHPRILMPAAHDERPLRLRIVADAIRASDALWYNTPEERALLEAVHPVASEKPSAVGAVGVEVPSTPGDAERFRATHAVRGPFLLYAGRTTAGKGFEELLHWFAKLREQRGDAQLVITADSAGEAAPGVRRIGHVDDESLQDALAAATAVVVPGMLESLSIVALQAWAAGCPCLLNAASPVLRGQAERSGGALLFDSGEEFVRAATALLDNAWLAERLGSAGGAFVAANYRWDAVVARLDELVASARTEAHRAAR